MGRARIILVLVALAAVGVMMSVFYVHERELALKFRFGEVIRTDYEPGLHFKVPIVNNVAKFPKQILTINNPGEPFLTFEKKNLLVDFFVKWRINNARDYYTASGGGDEIFARSRLLEIVKDGIRAEFAKRTVPEVVSAERRELMDNMLDEAGKNVARLGIDLIDVRVKRIDFSEDVSESVFNRMQQERARKAAELRAEGAETAEQIRSAADRERTVILAEAYKEAEKIRGEGDAKAAETYANAYSKNEEFYSFVRRMQAYQDAFSNEQDLLVIDPDSDFFRYLNETGGQ